jgi:hypothetical protein
LRERGQHQCRQNRQHAEAQISAEAYLHLKCMMPERSQRDFAASSFILLGKMKLLNTNYQSADDWRSLSSKALAPLELLPSRRRGVW